MAQDPMLPPGTTQADLDKHYGDGSSICDDCDQAIPEDEEFDTGIRHLSGYGTIVVCQECKEIRDEKEQDLIE